MKFIIDRAKYIDSGLVNEQFHPTLPLVIYNYSQQCQFAKAWDEVTMACRGLIVNVDTREIVARPFPKFFNYEEHIANKLEVPKETPYILKKLDGSLGILYWDGDLPCIATRGSFKSDQAIWATNWIRENIRYEVFSKKETYLFEIIYPQNRIVVNYDFSGLVLLEVIDPETGKRAEQVTFPKELRLVEQITTTDIMSDDGFIDYDKLKSANYKNEEGYVLYFSDANLRLKIKFEDYVRLHKIMTGLSEIGIWEMLRDGQDPITPEIPDEMHDWISGIVNRLRAEFATILGKANLAHQMVHGKESRKEQAIYIMEHYKDISGIVFSLLDNKNREAISTIWKMIRPRGSITFKKDIDA